MKTSAVLWLVAALAAVPSVASAQVIIRERAPGVIIEAPGPPGVMLEQRERGPGVGMDEDERGSTTGAGPSDDNCRRTTVHKENADGTTTTIRKKECD